MRGGAAGSVDGREESRLWRVFACVGCLAQLVGFRRGGLGV